MAVSSDEYRQALSRWASGVTIVTARHGERIHGMTVSAFTAVSLDPPLVLICAERSSHTLPVIAEGGVFAVNVLSRDQSELSSRFASKKYEWRRFDGLEMETGATGAPLLRGVVANIDCRVVAAHTHGDHIVYIGSVEEVRHFDREPLVYFRGAYGSLAP
jgi:flavin reductase (DIM6/NTAB) family NADH-FMN oxidoreductase RutF